MCAVRRGRRTQDAYMEAGGTIPWTESVESSLEQRPRKRREHVFERRMYRMYGGDV